MSLLPGAYSVSSNNVVLLLHCNNYVIGNSGFRENIAINRHDIVRIRIVDEINIHDVIGCYKRGKLKFQ